MTLDEYLVQLKWRLERERDDPAPSSVVPFFAAVARRLVALLETWYTARDLEPETVVVGDLAWRTFARRFLKACIVPQAPTLAVVMSNLAPALVVAQEFWELLDELSEVEAVQSVYWRYWGSRLLAETCSITDWWRYVFGYGIAALMYVFLVESPFVPGDEPLRTGCLENAVVAFPKLEKPN